MTTHDVPLTCVILANTKKFVHSNFLTEENHSLVWRDRGTTDSGLISLKESDNTGVFKHAIFC